MSGELFDQYVGFVNYYIHQVNLLRHLMGAPYRPVFADKGGRLLVAEAENGVTGTIEMSPYRTTIDGQEEALVCFERGWVKIELPAPVALNRPGRVTVYSDPGDGETPTSESPTLPWVHAMRQQATNFLASVRGERAPLTTAAEALEDLRVAREYLRLHTGE
jgi:predicted dehydrogenase